MQAGITKIRYNNAGQLDYNAGRFEIGIDLKLVYNNKETLAYNDQMIIKKKNNFNT